MVWLMRLGIDLGTTRTVIAAAEEGRYPVASFELAGQWQDHLPGIAALGDDGLCFGTRARQALVDGSDGAVASIKRAVSSRPKRRCPSWAR